MNGVIVYYFEFLILAACLFFLVRSIRRSGFSYIPAAVSVVLGLLMVLSRVKKDGVFNVTYVCGLVISLAVVYLLLDFIGRKAFTKNK